MALIKQPININFAQGLDTKTDPYQVAPGNFLRLQNSVFNKYKRLSKRNGYRIFTELPTDSAGFLATFDDNLTSIGTSLQAYSAGSNTWVNKGPLQPISLETLSLIRNNYNQSQVDAAVSPNNFVCTVYSETGSGSTIYKYALADSVTGQNILPPAVIPSGSSIALAPRVFFMSPWFIIVTGTSTHLQYCAINMVNPVAPVASTTISTQFTPDTRMNFDGTLANGRLYLAWNGSDLGGAIRACYLTPQLGQSNTAITAGVTANILSINADETTPTANLYISYWTASSSNGYDLILAADLSTILAPTQVITSTAVTNLTGTADSGGQTLFYEVSNNYSYDSAIPTHFIRSVTCTLTGTVGTPKVVARSVGLASKAFLFNSTPYFLAVYSSPTQPTYFLLNSSGQVISRLAYSNGDGYKVTGLPGVTQSGDTVSMPYQFKDLIEAVNKEQGVANPNGIYSQTGLNLVTYTFGSMPQAVEIGSTLNLTGGFLWTYDGYSPVENDFFLWPDSIEATVTGSGGFITSQQYFYQVVYEWTDNQGNIYRSAPSIPLSVNIGSGSTNTVTLHIPTLRLTYKISSPVKITIYRWSAGQQDYYEVTSIATPLINDPTVDSVDFADTLADTSILGNALIYTTGGVIEDIGAPSFRALTLFDSRMWGIDAEDPNVLWYSKQVIKSTPVEMSNEFTLYIAPTIATTGSTGPNRCAFPMDDKLVLFKKDALYYINGVGPDNTGANSQYSEPIFIASTVGSSNQASIVIIPEGLMFQSDKGIWLLDRGLGTSYIGAQVEDFTQNATVVSAVSIPGTNQVRFTLDSGITLMYDYFFKQWGTFTNVPALSATIYNGLHTFINSFGQVLQETPGEYLDGSRPVLQGLTTAWIASAGLIGFQRSYWLNLLGTYISPHTLNVQVAYDYSSSPSQSTAVKPSNFTQPWGGPLPGPNPSWGSEEEWGGTQYGNIELERVFFQRGKCTSFQIIIDEVYDPSFGAAAGAGLTLSGLNLTIGVKKAYPTRSATRSFG